MAVTPNGPIEYWRPAHLYRCSTYGEYPLIIWLCTLATLHPAWMLSNSNEVVTLKQIHTQGTYLGYLPWVPTYLPRAM